MEITDKPSVPREANKEVEGRCEPPPSPLSFGMFFNQRDPFLGLTEFSFRSSLDGLVDDPSSKEIVSEGVGPAPTVTVMSSD